MTKFPCKDCKDRAVGCHSKCEKYLTAWEEHQNFMREYKAKRESEEDVNDFKLKTIYATQRYYGKK